MAGTVGAIFNSGIELGSAVGIAVDASIETNVENKIGLDGFQTYAGRRATFWWLLAACAVVAIAILVFYRTGRKLPDPNSSAADSYESDAASNGSEAETRNGSRCNLWNESASMSVIPRSATPVPEQKAEKSEV